VSIERIFFSAIETVAVFYECSRLRFRIFGGDYTRMY